MVALTRIYTKGGDKGKTSLGTGQRVSKSSKRIKAIGAVDELNAFMGLCLLELKGDEMSILKGAQNDLFDVGADLCVLDEKGREKLRITCEYITPMEGLMDELNEKLSPLKSFILPGGSRLSSYLHLARTVCRRAEREVVDLSLEEEVSPFVIQYLNRLSDLLFVLARVHNDWGNGDVLWSPGKSQIRS